MAQAAEHAKLPCMFTVEHESRRVHLLSFTLTAERDNYWVCGERSPPCTITAVHDHHRVRSLPCTTIAKHACYRARLAAVHKNLTSVFTRVHLPCVLMQPLDFSVTLRLPATLRLPDPSTACDPSPHQGPPTSLIGKPSLKNPQAPGGTLSHKAFTVGHAPVAGKPL
ncbi:hypothetical protein AMTR_s00027p00197630 [Amborella trichopoda]|uniref:Uncharacterized protein n=1 Tax=Amborella trichopoda TaxID=13333 RepID=W1PTZ9_AMBTC|nr:hypothetical protein AMTR_s00027p00197630 [Amborella trichopoda]